MHISIQDRHLCCPPGIQCTKDDMQAIVLASTTLLADQVQYVIIVAVTNLPSFK